ncbi:MAG: microviridin/marinostatin family tricyclic proteinase inhibitor [Microcoleaceae cyanobacterium]
MSKEVKTSAPQAVPFFARFLEEQAAQSKTPYPQTLKYPSDWEDY